MEKNIAEEERKQHGFSSPLFATLEKAHPSYCCACILRASSLEAGHTRLRSCFQKRKHPYANMGKIAQLMQQPSITRQANNAWLLAMLSATALVFSFPKYECWWLACIAFVPFFVLPNSAPIKTHAKMAFLAGFIFHFWAFFWIKDTIVNYSNLNILLALLTLALFAASAALLFVFFWCTARWLETRGGFNRFWVIPVCFTVAEWLFPKIFPWYLGTVAYRHPAITQIVDIVGISGLTFIFMLTNVLAADALQGRSRLRAKLAVVVVLWAAVVAYGAWNLHFKETLRNRSLSYALIQPNVLIEERFSEDADRMTLKRLFDMTTKAAESKPDLIVWPEAVYPYLYRENRKERFFLSKAAARLKTDLLVGMVEAIDTAMYNGTLLFSGAGDLLGKYHKTDLLAFGEYIPLEEYFPTLSQFIRGPGQFRAGKSYAALQLSNGVRIASPICYEMIQPELVRKLVRDGVEVLVNITNDVWFGNTHCPYQHMALCVLRAVENRVPFIRCANTGTSVAVDQNGAILSQSPIFRQAIVRGSLSFGKEYSLYRSAGPLAFYACAIALAVATAMTLRRARKGTSTT